MKIYRKPYKYSLHILSKDREPMYQHRRDIDFPPLIKEFMATDVPAMWLIRCMRAFDTMFHC